MEIDADGSPHAYHPVNGRGLDWLGNAVMLETKRTDGGH
jgi:hypothetical protein